MTTRDLAVLVNLAERARAAGLIKFEEFTAVATSLEAVMVEIRKDVAPTVAEQSQNESTDPTPKRGKTAKLD